jgi:hypothetical protein
MITNDQVICDVLHEGIGALERFADVVALGRARDVLELPRKTFVSERHPEPCGLSSSPDGFCSPTSL